MLKSLSKLLPYDEKFSWLKLMQSNDPHILEIIKNYISNGSNVNACYHSKPKDQYDQFTPLHFAIKYVKFEIIKFLLENGANVKAVDAEGKTPLHSASQLYLMRDVVQIIELLITKFHSDLEARDKRGNTPLLSMFDDYPNMGLNFRIEEAKIKFDIFLKNGANVKARNNAGDTILHLVIKALRFRHCHSYMPYMSFDDSKHAEFVEQILEHNGDLLEVKNNEGKTPLQLAVSMASADVVKVLLGHNADVTCIKFANGKEKIFCYPNIIPNFDVAYSILSIIHLLVDRGFEFSYKDHLVLLKFLIHEVDRCNCSSYHFDNSDITFSMLEYGSTAHAKRIFKALKEDITCYSKLKDHLCKYLRIVKEANFYLDAEKGDILFAFTQGNYKGNYALYAEEKKELARLKTDVKLKNGLILFDLMSKHPYTASRFLSHDNFDRKLIDNFIHCKVIIEGYITQAIVRNYIVKSAHAFLELLSLSVLPELCNELIMSFLSNVDIFNLCSAALV